MFQGKEFCIINGPREHSKEETERKIAEVSQPIKIHCHRFHKNYTEINAQYFQVYSTHM